MSTRAANADLLLLAAAATYVRAYVRTYVLFHLRTYVRTYCFTHVRTYARTYVRATVAQFAALPGIREVSAGSACNSTPLDQRA